VHEKEPEKKSTGTSARKNQLLSKLLTPGFGVNSKKSHILKIVLSDNRFVLKNKNEFT
jgi:hypothetical protein